MPARFSGIPRRRRGSAIAALGLVCAFAAICGVACSDKGGASTSGAASGAASGSAAPAGTVEKSADDDLKPLFPIDGSPPDPLAERFCQAIHDAEASRRGGCCGIAGEVGRFTKECTRTLSAALRSKASTIDPAAVDVCAEAVSKDLEGCGWVGSSPPPLPEVCSGIIRGQLAERAVCRSSLECADGLACQGLTATRTGRCGPPKPAGLVCGGSVDTLAALTRQNRTEETHPECAGYCARVCNEAIALGGACKANETCGPGRRCIGGKCSADPYPGPGQACASSKCAPGARCLQEKCITPKGEGEACEVDAECRGACLKADGATSGKCGKRCVVMKIPTGPPVFSVKVPAPSAPPKR